MISHFENIWTRRWAAPAKLVRLLYVVVLRLFKEKSVVISHVILGVCGLFKENQNAPRPSEHPPVREEKCQNV